MAIGGQGRTNMRGHNVPNPDHSVALPKAAYYDRSLDPESIYALNM